MRALIFLGILLSRILCASDFNSELAEVMAKMNEGYSLRVTVSAISGTQELKDVVYAQKSGSAAYNQYNGCETWQYNNQTLLLFPSQKRAVLIVGKDEKKVAALPIDSSLMIFESATLVSQKGSSRQWKVSFKKGSFYSNADIWIDIEKKTFEKVVFYFRDQSQGSFVTMLYTYGATIPQTVSHPDNFLTDKNTLQKKFSDWEIQVEDVKNIE